MVASTLDVSEEQSIVAEQTVNSGAYVSLHNSQMFSDGLSFSGFERNKLWINGDDGWVDLSDVSGADLPNDSRAVITADFDDDGDLDLFVHSIQRERHALLRNDALVPGADAGFLKLRLRATTGQYEAIGATVIVEGPNGPTAQVLSRGAGFLSCQAPELVFGLGAAREAEVAVIWPGGRRESFGRLRAGSRALLEQGTGEARAFAARPRPLPDPPPPGLKLFEGDVVTRLALRDASGATRVLDLTELAGGKPIFLNFWASYCAPCVGELPTLAGLQERGEARVVAISVDGPSALARAKELLAGRGPGLEGFYLGAEAPAGAVGIEDLVDLDRLTIPTTLVLSPEGRVESILRGPIGADGER